MPLRDLKYKRDQTILKVYGYGDNKKIKVVRMNWLRTAGVEDDEEYISPKGSVHDFKLGENIRRAKNIIFEYAFCNPWDWFFTGTLDPKKYDRTNLDKFHKDLTQWFRDYGKQHNVHIKFLLVPEKHSDGVSWHIHGFLYGLPSPPSRAAWIEIPLSAIISAMYRSLHSQVVCMQRFACVICLHSVSSLIKNRVTAF